MTGGTPPRPEPAPSNAGKPEQVFFTISEVAQCLRVSERTVRRRVKDLTLCKAPMPGRLVRISADELARLAGREPLFPADDDPHKINSID